MKSETYRAALYAAGVPNGLPVLEEDRRAALLLRVAERTARRYRTGTAEVPGPVWVALKLLAERCTAA